MTSDTAERKQKLLKLIADELITIDHCRDRITVAEQRINTWRLEYDRGRRE